MKSLNVGMIGYQFMGRAHSNAWRQADKFFDLKAHPVLHTICGRNAREVAAAGKKLGWSRAETDWQKVVANPEIDIIDINTSNEWHAPIAIAAARAGKHILCEKPLALDAKEARSMMVAAEKAGVVNMVCHNYRRIPALVLAQRIIAAGDLGKIYHYRARYLQDWIVDPAFPFNWRFDKKRSGSDANGDINAHIIDLARYLVGEFQEVCGAMQTFIRERPLADKPRRKARVTVDDAVITLARMKNGALATLEATRMALGRKNHIQLEINGSKGSLVFDLEDMNRLKFYSGSDPADRRGYRDILITEPVHPYIQAWWPPGHIIGYEHTFIHTVADFVNGVVRGKPVQPTFRDGWRNQIVLDAIEKSSRTGKWVGVA